MTAHALPAIPCRVERVYAGSPDFSAGLLATEDGRRIRFRGNFHAKEGECITVRGEWKRHPKYGPQLYVKSLVYDLPETPEGLVRYLADHKAFAGIGEATARKLVDYAGSRQRLDALIRDGEELRHVLRIPAGVLETLRKEWTRLSAENETRAYLASFELTPHQIDAVLARFGMNAVGLLRSNPYLLIREVRGFGFRRVDDIARKMGVAKPHPGRIRAGLVECLREEVQSGHTWIASSDLLVRADGLLCLDTLDGRDRIRREAKGLVEEKILVAEGDAISTPELRDAEGFIRDTLARYGGPSASPLPVARPYLAGLLPGQAEAVRMVATRRIGVIAGSAGTGKTLTVARIAQVFQDAGFSAIICAPTGKAAKRAEELLCAQGVCCETSTIHRMLQYNGHFFRAEIVDADVIIADESSMICVELMAELLRHIDFARTRLVLVGDPNQLPSVGPGSVLRDILDHSLAPHVLLTEVVRQAGILKQNSTAILDGVVHPGDSTNREWIVMDRSKEPTAIQARLRDLIRVDIPKTLGFDPLRDVQILSPTHKGPLGTQAVNLMCQYLHHGPVKGRFTAGDRVVQRSNDYDLEIFNGSTGTIQSVNEQGLTILFDMEGERDLSWEQARDLKLAYCLSIHSYQGSEARCVVLLMHKSHWHACRQLLYTGVTRARETLILLGDRWGIRQAAKDRRSAARRTLLSHWAR